MNIGKNKKVVCPHCKKHNLRPIKDNDKIIGYICLPGCGSKFHVDYIIDFSQNKILYLLKRCNQKFYNQLRLGDSDDITKSITKLDELKRNGILQYTNIYVVESRKFN
jgi:transposase-like protein